MIPRDAACAASNLTFPSRTSFPMTTALHDLDALEPIDIDGLKAQGVPPVAQYLVDQEKFVLLGGKRGIYRLHLLGQSLTRLTVELA